MPRESRWCWFFIVALCTCGRFFAVLARAVILYLWKGVMPAEDYYVSLLTILLVGFGASYSVRYARYLDFSIAGWSCSFCRLICRLIFRICRLDRVILQVGYAKSFRVSVPATCKITHSSLQIRKINLQNEQRPAFPRLLKNEHRKNHWSLITRSQRLLLLLFWLEKCCCIPLLLSSRTHRGLECLKSFSSCHTGSTGQLVGERESEWGRPIIPKERLSG